MTPRNMLIAGFFVLSGSFVGAQNFETTIEAASAALMPSLRLAHSAADVQRSGSDAGSAAKPNGGASLCPGSRVVHSRYGAGVVSEIFTNGTVKVLFDSVSSRHKYIDRGELGIGVRCYQKLCEKSRVVHSRYGAGIVSEVFTNGVVKVLFDEFSSRYKYIDASELGAGVRCDCDE